MKSVAGKCFLVTGGGSGLGAAVVELLIKRDAKAVVLDMDEVQGTKFVDSLNKPSSVFFMKADVTSEEAVLKVIKAAKEKFGDIHGVVNCAGVGGPSKFVSANRGPFPLDLFKFVVNVNLTGTFNVSRLVAQEMLSQKPDEDGERGTIINVASVAAFEGQIGQVAYSASKGGVVSMTLVMARELARYGIRVSTIAPGTFETPMLSMLGEELIKKLSDQIPFPSRLGRPGEFAGLVLHMIENPMMNGEVVRLDGALRMAAL